MRTKPAAARRRRRDERGVVAVEAAIVLPIVILLIFGMVEFSLLLRDYVSVTAATRAGARVASAAADGGPCQVTVESPTCVGAAEPAVAQTAADAMQRALTGVPNESIDYLLVFKANATGFPGTATTMPTSCSAAASCVMFTWKPTANGGLGAFRYSSGTWASTSINACVNEQDSVGIYVKATHKWITGLFGSTFPVSDRAVMKFEPLSDDTCKTGRPLPHP